VGTDVVMVVTAVVVAGTVVCVGDTVWVVFAAYAGNTTKAAQTRNVRNMMITGPGELLTGPFFEMFHHILIIVIVSTHSNTLIFYSFSRIPARIIV
jgi:hypothetical protein